MKRVLAILLTMMLATTAFVTTTQAETDSVWSKYDDRLLDQLEADPDEVRVIALTVGSPSLAAIEAELRGAEIHWEYTIIDGFAATIGTDALHQLAERSDIESVWADAEVVPHLSLSHRAVEADVAWETAGLRGEGVSVAVLDSGIDQKHSYLAGVVSACMSFIRGVMSPECEDMDGHGSHVSGIVASQSDTNPGIAPGAKIAALRVLHAGGAGWTSDTIAAMEWVQENQDQVDPAIRVANLSLGPLFPGCSNDSNPSARAANALAESGVVVVVASGNAGHSTCTVDGAAAASNALTVGSVDMRDTAPQQDDVIASDSSGGPTTDGRLKPEVTFPGVGITSAYLTPFIATLDGTSMAAPHAAATAALLVQQNPEMHWADVKQRIIDTAIQTENTGFEPNSVYGHGLGNACLALLLPDCRLSEPPITASDAYVAELRINWDHVSRNHHEVRTTAVIVSGEAAEPLTDATVDVTLTSPEGVVHDGAVTTDGNGEAVFTVMVRHGGHGAWDTCVTGVTAAGFDYQPDFNAVTCASRVIDH